MSGVTTSGSRSLPAVHDLRIDGDAPDQQLGDFLTLLIFQPPVHAPPNLGEEIRPWCVQLRVGVGLKFPESLFNRLLLS